MSVTATNSVQRYVRRTSLNQHEYHTNFRKVDSETIATLTSDEASQVTSQMCKVYLCLINAPSEYWEREGVLRLTGCERGGEWLTAWDQLISLFGVASATARKALVWMSKEGVIGYYAGRNGVGIRIFINRAASSIGHKVQPTQKNLHLVQASIDARHTSRDDMPLRDSFAVLDNLDNCFIPVAPKSSADIEQVSETVSDQTRTFDSQPQASILPRRKTVACTTSSSGELPVDEIVERLKRELEPCVKTAAMQAASQAAAREHERTREWLDKHGLPKAARVAQREAYQIFKHQEGRITTEQRARAELQVGPGRDAASKLPAMRSLAADEISEIAEVCITMLELQSKPVEQTLAEISATEGWLLPEDVPRVREAAESLLRARDLAGRCTA